MFRFDRVDMAGGLLLIAAGTAVALWCWAYYPLGTVRRMGPGMFPMALGVILAGFGLILLLQSLRPEETAPDLRIWSPLFVLGGVAGFALTITPFGLIPAILVITVISSMAELRLRPTSLILLCAALSLMAPLIFKVGLGLQVRLFAWPF